MPIFNDRAMLASVTVLLIALAAVLRFGVSLTQRSAHAQDEAQSQRAKKDEVTPERRAEEAWLRPEFAARQAEPAATSEVIVQDINDITVMQADTLLARPPNPFDLNGRSVIFTPNGAGYTISTAGSSFDTNLGAKLDLTAPPAVNPVTQPGDDAYIFQDLGFNFNFYGRSFANVGVVSNGNLVFRTSLPNDIFDRSAVVSLATLIEMRTGPARIAAYWHDLDARAAVTQGAAGVYFRRDADRVVVTWNNLRDYPNNPDRDIGVQRFQATLFRDGRIVFSYDQIQLTTRALVGLTPGTSLFTPTPVNLSNGSTSVISSPLAEFFTLIADIDELAVARSFYAAHPNRDVYDFVFVMTDYYLDLVGAFAYYIPVRNQVSGIGLSVFDNDPNGALNARRVQGVIGLGNIAALYPDSPVTRFSGLYHGLGIMGRELGHRWAAAPRVMGGDPKLLLGRDETNWNFFFNTESVTSNAAAARSSLLEGNAWQLNNNGTYLSISLPDGYSRLDQYLMGLRPANQVNDSFVIVNPVGGGDRDRASAPRDGVTVTGTRRNVSSSEIISTNGPRGPDVSSAPRNFRAAFVLVVQRGTQPSTDLLNKITRYRLALESYFAQSTDYIASLNTGLAHQSVLRLVAASSAASFKATLAPGEITALFGVGLANGTAAAAGIPLPTTLAGARVLVNGTPAPLFFAAPGQINLQIPRGTPPGTALLEVTLNNQLIRAGAAIIAPIFPAVFTTTANGTGPAAAVEALTGAAAPFNPRRADGQPNIISVFGTGFGADATDIEGNVNANVQATLDGAPCAVLYAGRAPGFNGLNQINLQLPANVAAGTRTLIITRNGVSSAAVTLGIR